MRTRNEIAASSLNDVVGAISGKRIRHTRVSEIMGELDSLIYPESQDSILLVCGPSGAGKTTLAKHMVTTALKRANPLMVSDRGMIPSVYIEAPSSGESIFSWRLFYEKILAQLGDNLEIPKVAYGVDPGTGRMTRPHGTSRNTLAALRMAVERGLSERQVQFVVVDEAAHIIRQASGSRRLEIQLDTLKSLANECGTQIVLVGAYDLYQLVSLSGQIARRTHVLHFERYHDNHPEDVRAFESCIASYEKMLPGFWEGKLSRHAEALFYNTLGCIGTLSRVLTRSAKLSGGTWSVDALKRALLTEAQRTRILEEILDGESAIRPSFTRVFPKAPRIATTRPEGGECTTHR
uniref:AAA family ATPase n=1 Tax=Burkholderia anthina TaxID=179879 RepID=UPI00158B96B8|nr:AAA family ATPase [Burkholderia anthina]